MKLRVVAPRSAAFSLIEVLAVVAITALIAAIVFPVFVNARRRAQRLRVISNMHQCLAALVLYSEDSESQGLPSVMVAGKLVPEDITCDPADAWRNSCADPPGYGMLGSFGYLGALGTARYLLAQGGDPIVLMDVFHGEDRIPKPTLPGSPTPSQIDLSKVAFMPRQALVGKWDLSVRSIRFRWEPGEKGLWFDWFYLFGTANSGGY